MVVMQKNADMYISVKNDHFSDCSDSERCLLRAGSKCQYLQAE